MSVEVVSIVEPLTHKGSAYVLPLIKRIQPYIMKKLIFSLLLAACASTHLQAQSLTFGPKGGLNVATLTNYDRSGARLSFYAGGFANFAYNDMLSLQPEILYSGQGCTFRDILDHKYTVRLGYLNIPVMFQVRPVPQFYLEAGPQFGIGINSEVTIGSTTVESDDVKSDMGLGLGMGYQFPSGLGISARYVSGLNRVTGTKYEETHNNTVFSIGAFYTFNKRFKL